MVVKELVHSSTSNKFWLCPDKVTKSNFNRNELLGGIEVSTIPKELGYKLVTKYWKEDKVLCIIWKNEEV